MPQSQKPSHWSFSWSGESSPHYDVADSAPGSAAQPMVKRKKPKGAADQLSELVVDVASGDMPIVMVIRADKGKNPAAEVRRRMRNIKGKKVRSARPVHRRGKRGGGRGGGRAGGGRQGGWG